ncbi:MAG TPA: hypothetical protein PKE12_11570 [Kiritimatiellia bacterium]|nr:hypothetical protein [Kiritimatiellia bacterium]
MRRTVLMIPLVALATYLAPASWGELVWDWSASTPSQIQGQAQIINDNDGAEYDSYTLKLGDAMTALYNSDVAFQAYGSVQSMANNLFILSIAPDNALGEVNNGWNGTFDVNGDLQLTHVPGIPGLSYDPWLSTSSNPAQDMMLLQLTGNTPGYQFYNNPTQTQLGGVGLHKMDLAHGTITYHQLK